MHTNIRTHTYKYIHAHTHAHTYTQIYRGPKLELHICSRTRVVCEKRRVGVGEVVVFHMYSRVCVWVYIYIYMISHMKTHLTHVPKGQAEAGDL